MIFVPMQHALPGQKVWGCEVGKWSYIIVEDAGEYTASVRKKGEKTEYLIPYRNRANNISVCIEACVNHTKKVGTNAPDPSPKL
jgi:hypothetical protein